MSTATERGRALITGIGGFTGRYMAHELAANGWEVWGLGNAPATDPGSLPLPADRLLVADLMDGTRLSQVLSQVQVDAVVHLAAVAFVGHGTAADFYRVNVIGTRNLLEALAAAPTRPACVLLASSANVYGNATEGMLNEDTPPNPANDYAVSKLAMEWMARLWQDKLPLVLARPFNYTGVGQSTDFLLPKIVRHFRDGSPTIELGNLDVSRDFSDVRAVASAYRRLLEVRPIGETVNVCSGRLHSLREVISMAEEITGRQIQVRVNPAFVRANEVRTLCGDPSRLQSLIGDWQMPPLTETLRWMLEADEV